MSKLDLKTLKISESEWQKAWRDVGARGRVDWFLKMAFDSEQMELKCRSPSVARCLLQAEESPLAAGRCQGA